MMQEMQGGFKVIDIKAAQQMEMIEARVWSVDCPVPIQNLKSVELLHYDFLGVVRRGSIVVLDRVAENVEKIFRILFEYGFPIHSVIPIERFLGNDELSMAANNSSAFNERLIAGTDRVSKHTYGCAIDINPVQNPYVCKQENGELLIEPAAGKDFLDRTVIEPGMVETVLFVKNSVKKTVIDIFHDNGFSIWGGAWKSVVDYQHYEADESVYSDYIIKSGRS